MGTRTYLNFDLLIEREADGSYTALVTGSPVGAASSVRFHLPFDSTTLENLLLKLDPGRSGTRRTGADAQQQAAMDFGGPLYDAIFRDAVQLAWSRSQDLARDEAGGLRLRLRLTEAAEIAGLPWELLYDKPNNAFLAQSERTPLVRYLDTPSVPRTITVDGPLRVLAIISSPVDLEVLDVEGEWQRLREALSDRIAAGSVVLDRLAKPMVSELGPWLRRNPTHVIHFVGHGDFDERLREGVIYFQNRSGGSSPVTSSVLGPYVRDHDPLRMVVLNACRSARTDALDPFGGMAQGLVQQDATAVVAMQFPISDRAAVAFTGDFYGSLVDGLPVDQAVTSARKALLGEFRDEWATPVLFLRAPDGAIFEAVHAPTDAAQPRVEPPTVEPPTVEPPTVEPPTVEPPTVEPPTVEPPTTEPPTTEPPTIEAGAHRPRTSWIRDRRKALLVGGGGAAAVALVVTAALVALSNGDADDPTEPAAVLPVAREPLSADQLLVAAGPSTDELNIFRVDISEGTATAVTIGDGRKAGPSIDAERDTLVFAERKPGTDDFRLRTVDPATDDAATDGSDRELLQDVPAECEQSMERPARSPLDRLVIISPCQDARDEYRLVELDLATGDLRVLDEAPRVGDPTISADGDTVVYWTSDDPTRAGGQLVSLDLTERGADPRPITSGEWEDGDAVFSPVEEDTVVFRRRNDGGDFDLYVRFLDDAGPASPLLVGSTFDQDPTFSPDGTRIAFLRGQPGTSFRTYVIDFAPAAPDTTAETLLPQPISNFAFEMVPSWSRR